jgi:hypothetical protein
MKTLTPLLLMICLFFACSDNNDDPIIDLEILRPIPGSTLQVNEPAEIEVRFNAVEMVEKILFIINEQNIAVPDTLLKQTVQQSGNFNLIHNHVFQNTGTVSLRVEAFEPNTEVPIAISTTDFNVQ